MCFHLHQHCEGRLCVCVECGAEIPSLDWGQVDELYEYHQRRLPPLHYDRWTQTFRERRPSEKTTSNPARGML